MIPALHTSKINNWLGECCLWWVMKWAKCEPNETIMARLQQYVILLCFIQEVCKGLKVGDGLFNFVFYCTPPCFCLVSVFLHKEVVLQIFVIDIFHACCLHLYYLTEVIGKSILNLHNSVSSSGTSMHDGATCICSHSYMWAYPLTLPSCYGWKGSQHPRNGYVLVLSQNKSRIPCVGF